MNYKEWNEFVKKNAPDGGLLQSLEWGEFQESLGRKIFKFEIKDEKGALAAVALTIKISLPWAQNILYLSRGPVLRRDILAAEEKIQYILESLLGKIKIQAQKEKSVFLRLDPPWPQEKAKVLADLEFIKAIKEVQPKNTLILDLKESSEMLLHKMKAKTRYNIGLAERKGVKIKIDNGRLEDFWRLLKETSQRDQFRLHPREYYEKMFKVLGPEEKAGPNQGYTKLFLADYKGEAIAANLMAFFGSEIIYLHGASSYNFRHLMAPYLLHWKAMLEAQKRGVHYYDFWGVSLANEKKTWAGITRFKKSFCPEVPITQYLGAYELVYQPLVYKTYQLIKALKGNSY